MEAKIRTERLNENSTNEIFYFVAVYKNEKCIGTCMADDSMTPYECYQNVLNNQAIDRMESAHYQELSRQGY
jgi:hypothetical protein